MNGSSGLMGNADVSMIFSCGSKQRGWGGDNGDWGHCEILLSRDELGLDDHLEALWTDDH